MERRYWFRAKTIGWGLSPANTAGWIVVLAFVVIDTGGMFALMPFYLRSHAEIVMGWVAFWYVALFAVVLIKAEPHWWTKWGDGSGTPR